jgi:uncharacterized protein YcfJ
VIEMSTNLKTGLAAAASAALLGATMTANATQYANVVSATPVTNSVAVPRQDCVQSERLVQAQPSGAGALIGAIAGGVIGNQFGHGFGRAAATGAGVVAGAAVGNNVEASANPPVAVPVRNCRTVNAVETRVVGYDVVYEYNGQRYSTRLPEDPGPRLAVDMRPVGRYAPADPVAPSASHGAVAPPAYADPAPVYGSPAPMYSYYPSPAPAYYAPAPVVYGAPYYAPYYVGPAIGFSFGYWAGRSWGYHGGHGHWH